LHHGSPGAARQPRTTPSDRRYPHTLFHLMTRAKARTSGVRGLDGLVPGGLPSCEATTHRA
ncbi:MAG: hypothetical protein ACREF3_12265, partial [Acetobacteraceae bacterium]